jgi:hypothetical protein
VLECWNADASGIILDAAGISIPAFGISVRYLNSYYGYGMVADEAMRVMEAYARIYRPGFHENKPKTLVFT